MAKVVYDRETRHFSIQGSTGIILRRLKEYLDSAPEGETPKTPVFYKNLSINRKARLEYQINNLLNTSKLQIKPYMKALLDTRKYDRENGTKLLDNGFIIILESDSPIDGKDVGALINLKDRKGKDIYTYSSKHGEVLNWKEFKLSEIKTFSIITKTSKEYKFLVDFIKSNGISEEVNNNLIPFKFRNKVKEYWVIDSDIISDEIIDKILDILYRFGKLSFEDDEFTYRTIADKFVFIVNEDSPYDAKMQVYILK